MIRIADINRETFQQVKDFFIQNWGATFMVSRGNIHRLECLKGFATFEGDRLVGAITYYFMNNECEIVSLDSIIENCGTGTKLLNLVVEVARINKCHRVWLITTNDNTKAIRYYQKRGFNIKAIHINTIEKSRNLKPQIPLIGNDEIPILHEIEFELLL